MSESLLQMEQPVAVEPEIKIENNVTAEAPAEVKSEIDYKQEYESLKYLLDRKVTEWGEDELKAFDKVRGVAASAEEYNMPEGLDEKQAQWFKNISAELKLPKNVALNLADKYQEYVAQIQEESGKMFEAKIESDIQALKQEWGQAFEQRVKIANQAALNLGGEELIKVLSENGLGANPVVLKSLANLGQLMAEDKIPQARSSGHFGVTPEEAKSKINSMMSDTEMRKAYYNRFDPKHESVKAEVTKLYQLAYPE